MPVRARKSIRKAGCGCGHGRQRQLWAAKGSSKHFSCSSARPHRRGDRGRCIRARSVPQLCATRVGKSESWIGDARCTLHTLVAGRLPLRQSRIRKSSQLLPIMISLAWTPSARDSRRKAHYACPLCWTQRNRQHARHMAGDERENGTWTCRGTWTRMGFSFARHRMQPSCPGRRLSTQEVRGSLWRQAKPISAENTPACSLHQQRRVHLIPVGCLREGKGREEEKAG